MFCVGVVVVVVGDSFVGLVGCWGTHCHSLLAHAHLLLVVVCCCWWWCCSLLCVACCCVLRTAGRQAAAHASVAQVRRHLPPRAPAAHSQKVELPDRGGVLRTGRPGEAAWHAGVPAVQPPRCRPPTFAARLHRLRVPAQLFTVWQVLQCAFGFPIDGGLMGLRSVFCDECVCVLTWLFPCCLHACACVCVCVCVAAIACTGSYVGGDASAQQGVLAQPLPSGTGNAAAHAHCLCRHTGHHRLRRVIPGSSLYKTSKGATVLTRSECKSGTCAVCGSPQHNARVAQRKREQTHVVFMRYQPLSVCVSLQPLPSHKPRYVPHSAGWVGCRTPFAFALASFSVFVLLDLTFSVWKTRHMVVLLFSSRCGCLQVAKVAGCACSLLVCRSAHAPGAPVPAAFY